MSRPLLGLLVATVAFFALWIVALKPSTSSTSPNGTGPGLGSYQSAITAAHNAVASSNRAAATTGGATSAAPTTAAPTTARATAAAPVGAKPVTTALHVAPATHRLDIVSAALRAHKVVAILFYNPAGTDDRAVRQELAAVPVHRGRVVRLAVPLSELTRYTVVSSQVPVNLSPTLVLIDSHQAASTIVGFADRFEIGQRIADALAVR